MKKLLVIFLLISSINAGSDNALFDFDLGDTFGGADTSVSSIGTEDLIFMGFTLGIVLDENKLLYVSKGAAMSQTGSLERPRPSSFVVAYEQIGFEYIIDFGTSVDIGLALEAGSFIISDGNNSSGISMAGEATIYAVINITENLKLQLGYGQRFSGLSDADLVGLGLTKDQVDTEYYSMRLDIGAF